MPPIDPMLLQMLMQLLPEYSVGEESYMPPDVGSQSTQMNVLQDMMQVGSDPLFAGLVPGGFDPAAFEDVLDEEASEAPITAGRDNLQHLATNYPESVEGMIAQLILDGNTPRQAIDGLVAAEVIKTPKKVSKDGTETAELDLSERDYYLKKADSWFDQLAQDKEGKEVYRPSPAMQAYIDAGFEDPRQQYTNSYIDPRVDRNTAATGAADEAYRQAVTSRKGADADLQRLASRPSPSPHAAPAVDAAKSAMMNWIARATKGGDEGVPYNPMLPERHPNNMRAWGGSIDGDKLRQILTDTTPDRVASRNTGARTSAANRARSTKEAERAALKTAVNARVEAGKQNAAANAQADAMRRQGRTPFLDQYAQRQAMLRALGLGA